MAQGFDLDDKNVLVDYDDTIFDPRTGEPEEGVKKALERIKSSGLNIIISSSRTSKALHPENPAEIEQEIGAMSLFLRENGIPFDAIDDGTMGKLPGRVRVDNTGIGYRYRRNWDEIAALIVPYEGRQLIATVGFPGSGKSTLSRKLAGDGWIRICLDEISQMVGGSYGENRRVFHRVELEGIRAAFENNRNVIVDRTNLNREKRSRWSRVARDYKARATIVFVSVPVDEYKARNADRKPGEFVSDSAYSRHWDSFEFPNLQEEDYDELILLDSAGQTEVHQVKQKDGVIVNVSGDGETKSRIEESATRTARYLSGAGE